MKRTKSSWTSWAAIVVGFVAVTLGGFRNTAWSEDVAPPSDNSSLEQRVNQLDQQVKTLQQQVQSAQPTSQGNTQPSVRNAFIPPGQPTASANEPAGEATAGRSGFALRSADGDFILRLQGLLQVDGRFYSRDGANTRNYTSGVDASGQAPLTDTFVARRVRPILSGTLFHNYDFFFQPDFGNNTTAIYDAYFDVKPWSLANLRVGKFKTPLGLERLQTDSYLVFAERGLTADLTPQRDTGAEFYGGVWGNALTYQASFTNGVADGAITPDIDTNNAKEGTLRVFAQPFKNTGAAPIQGLGLGAAGSYTGENQNLPTYKTAAGQEQFFGYKAGVTFSGEQSHIVPQANYYWGPLGTYAEYAETNQVARVGSVNTRLTNDAWQGAVSWVLTGEKASYTGVIPNKVFDPHAGTWGAWELAARFQQLQIDPETFRLGFADPTVSASRATGYTVGLNWYLNKFVKFVADYEETWFQGGNGTGNRPDEQVFDTRWQLAF